MAAFEGVPVWAAMQWNNAVHPRGRICYTVRETLQRAGGYRRAKRAHSLCGKEIGRSVKITIETPQAGMEEEVIIRCYEIEPEVMQLISELKRPRALLAYQGAEIHRLPPKEVYYCEVVDDRTFLYTGSQMYESRQRLYELEEDLGAAFIRISKSVVVNIMYIKSLHPAINGRFEAVLENGETVVVSRQYVPRLKEYLGL